MGVLNKYHFYIILHHFNQITLLFICFKDGLGKYNDVMHKTLTIKAKDLITIFTQSTIKLNIYGIEIWQFDRNGFFTYFNFAPFIL